MPRVPLTLNKTFVGFFWICIVFRATLDCSYVYFVHANYAYAGFGLSVSLFQYTLSWLVYVLSLVFCSTRLQKPSQYVVVLSVLSLIAPLTSLYGLSERQFFPVLVTSLSLLGVRIIASSHWIKVPKIPSVKGGARIAFWISVLMVLYLLSWYVWSGAIWNFNLNFLRVYEYRVATAQLANIGFLSYLNTWVYNIFSIFLFSFCLYKRRYVAACFVFAAQSLFFAVSGHKTLFFLPLLVLAIWFYFRKYSNMTIVPVTFTAVVTFSFLMYLVFDELLWASLFIRRVFFIPAVLTYDYFDFFSLNAFVYWSNSILEGWVTYPYSDSVSKTVGDTMRGGASANNGYVSSGYAHAGVLGVGLYTIVFGLALRFLDVVSFQRLPVWLALAVTVVPLRNILVASDLLTVLMTHGLLVAFFLLLLARGSRRRCSAGR